MAVCVGDNARLVAAAAAAAASTLPYQCFCNHMFLSTMITFEGWGVIPDNEVSFQIDYPCWVMRQLVL